MDKQEELKGKLIEMGFMTNDKVKEEVDAAKEATAKALEENAELKVKVEALEKAPAVKVTLPVPGRKTTADFIYKLKIVEVGNANRQISTVYQIYI